MSFKQIRRSAAKSRRDNGLFFSSLVVAIVAFYTLLSLGSQDVMRFLKTMESDAVDRLMLLIPFVYMISLFFVFFLVYFAYRYQLEGRRREFGLYLMLGMKKAALFAMLMSETVWNSLVSILIGLPAALFLTEGISLATAKLVGLGIIGHRVSFSLTAVLGTVAGAFAVQMAAMLFLSAALSRKEPAELLRSASPEKQSPVSPKKGRLCFAAGLVLLAAAYVTGVTMLRDFNFRIVALILILGVSGTFLLYRGMGEYIGRKIRLKSPGKSGLFTFTGRQLQENVLYQYKALTVSSLLLLMAITCISFGIGTASGRGAMDVRTVDFSIDGSEQEISAALSSKVNKSMIAAYYPMFESSVIMDGYGGDDKAERHDFSWEGLRAAIGKQPETEIRDNMLENFSDGSGLRLISQTSYNALLRSIGREPIRLQENQAAVYTSMRDSGEFISTLKGALKSGAYVELDGQKYGLLPEVYYDNIVADRMITLYSALIVSDENYAAWASDSETPLCYNVMLSEKLVSENGLMQAISLMGKNLDDAGLQYESYLGGIGRNLFYTVAASYLTIYLGVLFMLIANTVIGLKYLMQQRESRRRYRTLLMLGAGVSGICASAKTQIRLFLGLALSVSALSSVFAVWSMFTSFLRLPAGASVIRVTEISGVSAVLFIVVECAYIFIAERAGSREILALPEEDRSDILE